MLTYFQELQKKKNVDHFAKANKRITDAGLIRLTRELRNGEIISLQNMIHNTTAEYNQLHFMEQEQKYIQTLRYKLVSLLE